MFSRLTNLLTLAALAVALVASAEGLYDGWNSVAPWEQEWSVIPGKEPKHASQQLIAAIRSASEVGAFNDADKLINALRSDFRPTGNVFIRLNESELFGAMKAGFFGLLLLLIPMSVNYLRHGRFRLWNRET